jgi:hypothetical protein
MAKEDLFLVIEPGTLSPKDGTSFASRVRVSSKNGIVNYIKIGKRSLKVQSGFGVEGKDAINDFIRRNSSDVLEEIFDAT